MAINYTQLFTSLGKIVKQYNDFSTQAAAMVAGRNAILAALQAETPPGSQALTQEGLATAFEGYRDGYRSSRESVSGWATKRLQDRATILNSLGLSTNQMAAVLPYLFAQMVIDSQTINRSTVTLGAMSANLNTPLNAQAGNGTVLTTRRLDTSAPGSDFMPIRNYVGVSTELTVVSDLVTATCSADSFTGSQPEGGETFTVQGNSAYQRHDPRVSETGSGSLSTVPAAHASTLLNNGDFENWTVPDTPDGWELSASLIPGTTIYQGGEVDAYHGLSGCSLKGDNTNSMILRQSPTQPLTGGKMYCISIHIKADPAIVSGTVTIQFTGTGYVAVGQEKITISSGALPTAWTLYNFFAVMPTKVPDDLALVLLWGSATAGKFLHYDDVCITPVTYAGGMGIVPVRGSLPFIRNDSYRWSVANAEGVFQSFFRQVYGMQLPSSATPSIADTLAG